MNDHDEASELPDYSEEALANRCIDFLEERADEWMADTGVQRMFNAIASVFEKYAPQEVMDRFREKLGVIGRQCHVEGALRVWEEIAVQQRALGRPLPSSDSDAAALIERQSQAAEALVEAVRAANGILEDYIGFLHRMPTSDLELHPYIPSVEDAFDKGAAALAAYQETINGTR